MMTSHAIRTERGLMLALGVFQGLLNAIGWVLA